MRATYKIALYLAGVAGCAALAKADPMDAYIMPAFSYTKHLSSSESVSRMGGRIEFGRFAKNIALDLRLGQGGGYSDYGTSFKAFGHWDLGDSDRFGLDLGAGAVVLFSGGYDDAVIQQSFYEMGLAPFVRFTYNTGYGFGVTADLGTELMLTRRYKATDAAEASSVNRLRPRVYFALGIPVEL